MCGIRLARRTASARIPSSVLRPRPWILAMLSIQKADGICEARARTHTWQRCYGDDVQHGEDRGVRTEERQMLPTRAF
eukprot:1680622-Prymnesium_polylepis.2